MYYNRFISLENLPYTIFLFGCRQSGKTSYLKHSIVADLYIDLLNTTERLAFSRDSTLLTSRIKALNSDSPLIIVDEIQKIPGLLDEIHRILESEKKVTFILTGSSARKLKRNQANLLGGRAPAYHLYPLTYKELGDDFSLQNMLTHGGLPVLWTTPFQYRKEILQGYVETYLKEEIIDEALTRNIPAFSRFLELAAFDNGNVLNYTNISRETGTSSKLIKEYFQILEDTLIGFHLLPYLKSHRERLLKHPRFYFIDNGFARGAARTIGADLIPGTSAYGKAFENFIITEVYKAVSYLKEEISLYYFHTTDGAEVDLIMERYGDTIAVEIKSSSNPVGLSGLHSFLRDHKTLKNICVCTAETPHVRGDVVFMPWKAFMDSLYEGKLFQK